jgi:hypothetical protein
MADIVEELGEIDGKRIALIGRPIVAVKFGKMGDKALDCEMNALTLYRSSVVIDQTVTEDGNQYLVAEDFLNNPFRNMNALDMADFPPFIEGKLHKAALDTFPRQKPAPALHDVIEEVHFIPLGRFLP